MHTHARARAHPPCASNSEDVLSRRGCTFETMVVVAAAVRAARAGTSTVLHSKAVSSQAMLNCEALGAVRSPGGYPGCSAVSLTFSGEPVSRGVDIRGERMPMPSLIFVFNWLGKQDNYLLFFFSWMTQFTVRVMPDSLWTHTRARPPCCALSRRPSPLPWLLHMHTRLLRRLVGALPTPRASPTRSALTVRPTCQGPAAARGSGLPATAPRARLACHSPVPPAPALF